MKYKLPFHFDMETADPDDSMTLVMLATHPKVHLASVSVHPGGKDQIGFVRRVLQILDREDIRIGSGIPKNSANRVSSFYRCWIGKFEDSEADDTAANIMTETLRQFPDCTLLTGAALTNPILCGKPEFSSIVGFVKAVLQAIILFLKKINWKNLKGRLPVRHST